MSLSPHAIRHLAGFAPRYNRGPRPTAVYRAVTRRDARPTTLADAIRASVGYDAIAGALHISRSSLSKNIAYGYRGVRPDDAHLIARMVDRPLADIFIDTRIKED